MRNIISVFCLIAILTSCSNNSKLHEEMSVIIDDNLIRLRAINSMNNLLYDELLITGDSLLSTKVKKKSLLIKTYVTDIKRGLISNHIYDCDTFQRGTYSVNLLDKNGEKKESIVEQDLSQYPLIYCGKIDDVKKTSKFFTSLVSKENSRASELKTRLKNYKTDMIEIIDDKSGLIMELINLYDVYDPLNKLAMDWEYYKFTNVSFASSVVNLESILLDIELVENYSLNKLKNNEVK